MVLVNLWIGGEQHLTQPLAWPQERSQRYQNSSPMKPGKDTHDARRARSCDGMQWARLSSIGQEASCQDLSYTLAILCVQGV